MRPLETLGHAVGAAIAPVVALGAALRRDRLLHARGVTYRAEVRPLARGGPEEDLARRLAGPAVVRLSSALWREREWPDLLGLALRVGGAGEDDPGVQDLLFSTLRHAWTIPGALVTTDPHDFLRNDYYALAPFHDRSLGRVELRLVSTHPRLPGAGRSDRLDAAVHDGTAVLQLEVRAGWRRGWRPVVEVTLRERASGAALRADPFRAGQGLVPVGFLNAVRRAAYGASRAGGGRG